MIVASLELCGRDHADLAVQTSSIEPVDVVKRRPFNVFHVAPRSLPVDQFGLEESVERFGERIIVAVAATPN